MSNVKKRQLYVGTEAQFETNKSTLPINSEVFITDPIAKTDLSSDLQNQINTVLYSTTDPTTSTVGYVGQLMVVTNGKTWKCTAISGSTYTWEIIGGSNSLYLHSLYISGTNAGNTEYMSLNIYNSSSSNFTLSDLQNLLELIHLYGEKADYTFATAYYDNANETFCFTTETGTEYIISSISSQEVIQM